MSLRPAQPLIQRNGLDEPVAVFLKEGRPTAYSLIRLHFLLRETARKAPERPLLAAAYDRLTSCYASLRSERLESLPLFIPRGGPFQTPAPD